MISHYELGDRIPSPEVLRKLAFTLHAATIDVSGLDEQDRLTVEMIVSRLREKNK